MPRQNENETYVQPQTWIPACPPAELDVPHDVTPIMCYGSGRARAVRNSQDYLDAYWHESPPVGYVAEPQSVPHFGSLRLFEGAPTVELGDLATPQPKEGLRQHRRPWKIGADITMYVGGPVWGLDWAPEQNARRSNMLAVAAHPRGREENITGECIYGPAMVQIWEISKPGKPAPMSPDTPSSSVPTQSQEPAARLLLAICHNGGVTWDCKWQRGAPPQPNAHGVNSAGSANILALAIGSGEVCILRLPDPANLAGPFVDVEPLTAIRVPGSPASVLEWLPSKPYDRLLVGCWDGSVLLCRFSEEEGRLDLLSQLLVGGGLPIRALAWPPPEICEGSADLNDCNVFASSGHEGCVKIWDAREAFLPLYTFSLSISWVTAMTWMRSAIVAGLDGGNSYIISADGAPADKAVSVYPAATADPIWAMHACPGTEIVAAVSGTGEVACYPIGYSTRNRLTIPHAPIAGFKGTPDGLCVMGQHAIDPLSRLYPGEANCKVAVTESAVVMTLDDPLAPVHRVRWGPRVSHTLAWLAHGGAAGIVRCQAVYAPPYKK